MHMAVAVRSPVFLAIHWKVLTVSPVRSLMSAMTCTGTGVKGMNPQSAQVGVTQRSRTSVI